MNNDTQAFIDTLRRAGVSLSVEGEQLRLRADKGVLTPEMREGIAARKQEILARLIADPARIKPALRPARIPLSFAQQRLWFLDQLVGASPTYNISSALRIEGSLDHRALEGALNDIVARHEGLRTTFGTHDGEPFQRIAAGVAITVTQVDLGHLGGEAREAACERAIASALRQSFDLARDPMLRATLVRLADDAFVLVLLVHHIAADGWSIGVLVDELTAFYAARVEGRRAALPPLPVQYADFTLWQREWLTGDNLTRQLDFWRGQLDGAPPLLDLPSDRPRPARESFAGAHWGFRLPAALNADLNRLARSLDTTLYAVLLAGFYTLLQRYSGEGDLVVGSPIANRNRRELEPMVGFFVNTLALRARLSDDMPFEELVRQVGATTRAAFDHQDLPFERLVDELAPERDMSHAPLFQTAFALQNAPRPPLKLSGLTITPIVLDNGTSKFDLFLSMHEDAGELVGMWEYATDLFDPDTVERFTRHLRTLLASAVTDPARAVGELAMLSDAERRQQLAEWNRTTVPAASIVPFPHRFEAMAVAHAEHPALAFAGRTLSYGELDAMADRLAAILHAARVERGSMVGICLPRGFDAWIAVMAVMKAGGAYVPLDPAYPPERLAYIVADAAMPLVVTDGALAERLGFKGCRTLLMEALPDAPEPMPHLALTPDDLAYVIYTSGSTGRPKGTLLRHGGLGNLAGAVSKLFAPGEGDKVLQFASLNFDASAWEMAMALGSGACLQLVAQEAILPDAAFADFLARERVTHATLPPSFLAALPMRPLPDLRELVVAGEAVPKSLIARWAPGRRFTNAYGPTEATVCATAGACSADDAAVTIGRPIDNTRVYILRGEKQLLPVGAAGELVIGGLGVARGYHQRPELTARQFGDDPFGEGRIYRTGDLVRYRPDGAIEFLGRIDHQTKLRGFRIEPGEIEAAIRRSGWVREALVMSREDEPGEKRLAAYIEPEQGDAKTQAERLDEWRDLFQTVYGDASAFDRADADEATLSFNIAGWNSVYDGSPLPASQMREWLESTVEEILALAPSRVLEIGCGSGLILSRVAPHCAHYRGTDLSHEAVAYVSRLTKRLPGLANVTVSQQAADDFSGLEEGGYDLVVINSVAQYFPGVDYLCDVLTGAARLLAPGGAIFVGDVRSLPLMEALHISVQFSRASDETPRASLRERVRRTLMDEEELHVDPAFFHALAREVSGLDHAEIHLKRGRVRDELNAFRYQAVLRTQPVAEDADARRLDWRRDGLTLDTIASIAGDCEPVVITRIPNARLAGEMAMRTWLRESGDDMVAEWRARRDEGGIEPESLHEIAKKCGCRLHLTWSADGGPAAMDAAFSPLVSPASRLHAAPASKAPPDWRAFGNNPLFGKLNRMLVPRLREFLKESLPDYMIPAAFVMLESFPVTPNGKIDRAALPAPSGEVATAAAHVPPSNRAEEILAGIWSQLLRLERVGMRDNFFEIGGDSIVSIQVISRAREAGLHLSPRDLFQHQTIAELARVAREDAGVAVEQGPVTGPSETTPIQSWFFETIATDHQHFNMAMLVAVRSDLRRAALLQALASLVDHHDALRSRFQREGGSRRQEFLKPVPGGSMDRLLSWIDLGGVSEGEREGYVRETCETLQASLDPAAGDVMRVAVFDQGEGREKLLFLVVHHLVIDAVSWRILQEDFTNLYRMHSAGEPIALPPKTHSFKDWSAALARFAASPACLAELHFWTGVVSGDSSRLPRDRDGENSVASEAIVSRKLSPQASLAFAGPAQAAYRTQANDLLLAALLAAIAEWTGAADLRFDLEGHGRREIEEGLDLSRTVGWFTALYPVRLSGRDFAPEALIPSVKEQLRTIPGQGLGYGALRYLARHPALVADAGAEISFNYLGQFNRETAPGSDALIQGFPDIETGPIHSPRQMRPYVLQINASMIDGELAMRWHYSRALHDEATIGRLADRLVAQMEALIAHCTALDQPRFTPSDFDAASLSVQELALLPLGEGVIDVYDAAPLQEGMLFAGIAEPASGAYIEQVALDLAGALDPGALVRAWQGIVARHAVLRTGFHWEGQSHCRQVVRREVELPFAIEDWRKVAPQDLPARYAAFIADDKRAGFDLTRPPLMRLSLLRLGEESWRLVWTSHHILMDGWCLPIIFSELRALYEAEVAGTRATLAPPHAYKDFIRWRRAQDVVAAQAFWCDDLAGLETPTLLAGKPSADAADDGVKRLCGVHRFEIPTSQGAALDANARAHRLTMNTLLQAAWSLLLAHETGTSDVIHGTTVSGRPPAIPGVEEMVGLFINTLPVRTPIQWSRPLEVWLAERQAQQAARDAQGFVSLREIQGWSEAPRGMPLFDTLFVFENFPFDETLQRADLHSSVEITGFEAFGETSFPLTAVASAPEDRLAVRLTYDRALYDEARIETLARRFATLLGEFAGDLKRPVSALSPVDSDARAQFFALSEGASREWSGPATIEGLLAREAALSPQAIAVSDGERSFGYAELADAAGSLAGRLAAAGCRPGSPVGLLLDRKATFVLGLLGAWRNLSPFVPLDPRWPQGRLAEVIAEAGITHVVTDGATPLPGVTRVPVEGPRQEHRAARALRPDDLAYIIFTSGSTGRPKGVCIEHRQLHHYVRAVSERLGIRESQSGAVFATTSGFAADLGYTMLFASLACGGRLSVIPDELASDPDALAARLRDDPIDYLKTVPSHFEALSSAADHAALVPRQAIVFGGEALPWRLVDQVAGLAPQTAIFNHYGPTETTIGVTCGRVDDLPAETRRGEIAPLGKPLTNARAYVLNEAMLPVPTGAPGEIFIGGETVGRGYLDRPDLTATAFVRDPFGPGLLYRTGDRARRLDDGSLIFLGRGDSQLKIRGYRVEPEEIAAILRRRSEVRACVVVGRNAPAGKRLVAYVEGTALDIEDIRRDLRERLPDYMVPAAIVALDAIPRLGNGKIDLRALPEPEAGSDEPKAAPRSDIEERLAAIFATVLRLPQVGIHDNFFDLGGDSIVSIQIVAAARQAGLQLTTRQIFSHQTIAELAFVAEPLGQSAAEQGVVTGDVPLTPIQRRFFAGEPVDPQHYNQAMIFAVSPELDPRTLEPALATILSHHDALRLRLSDTGGNPRQRIADLAEAGDAVGLLNVVDLSTLDEAAQAAAIEAQTAQAQAGLDLVAGPLTRLTLFLRGDRAPLLHWAVHHIAIDGVSWRILLEDLDAACRQIGRGEPVTLPPKSLSFRGWAEILAEHARSQAVADELPFWRAAGEIQAPALPLDHPPQTGSDDVASAERISVALSADETASLLQDVHNAYHTQINDILLCGLSRAFGNWTGGRSVTIDLEGHGREPPRDDIDISRTVGWFTSLYPVRLDVAQPGGAVDPSIDIKAVKEQLRSIAHGGIGYGLLRYMTGRAELGGHASPQVVFNYLGQFDNLAAAGREDAIVTGEADHGAGPMRSMRQMRPHLLQINALVLGGELRLSIDYSRNRHRAATIERLAETILAELRILISHCLSPNAGGHTPSDFGMAGLDNSELAKLAGLLSR